MCNVQSTRYRKFGKVQSNNTRYECQRNDPYNFKEWWRWRLGLDIQTTGLQSIRGGHSWFYVNSLHLLRYQLFLARYDPISLEKLASKLPDKYTSLEDLFRKNGAFTREQLRAIRQLLVNCGWEYNSAMAGRPIVVPRLKLGGKDELIHNNAIRTFSYLTGCLAEVARALMTPPRPRVQQHYGTPVSISRKISASEIYAQSGSGYRRQLNYSGSSPTTHRGFSSPVARHNGGPSSFLPVAVPHPLLTVAVTLLPLILAQAKISLTPWFNNNNNYCS